MTDLQPPSTFKGNPQRFLLALVSDPGAARSEVYQDGQLISTDDQRTATTERARLRSLVDERTYALLSPTDFYVTRKSETGRAIPADVSSYRSEVRSLSDSLQSAISQAATLADLDSVDLDPLLNFDPFSI
jgi:hypothetical protein